jgi:hypothetical protein
MVNKVISFGNFVYEDPFSKAAAEIRSQPISGSSKPDMTQIKKEDASYSIINNSGMNNLGLVNK